MFPNFLNNVRDTLDHVAHDVAQQAERFRASSSPRRSSNTDDNMNAFASSLFGFGSPPQHHQQQQQQQQQPGNTRRAPPASSQALRQLPTIRVTPEDLVDPSNRECCVCLEEHKIDDRVTRMPCAHIFHTDCIMDWLTNHSCTCPVCRYELQTDDPQYEAGRIERMKTRKPRYALHELKRMKVSELIALNRQRPVPGGMEKNDLIQYLIDQERIDIIPTPEPVEYELETLRGMKIKELKASMEEAGVYFRPEDVVEKDDMISIFKNSGRLILLPSSSSLSASSSTTSSNGVSANSNTSTPAFTNESSFMDQDCSMEDSKPSARGSLTGCHGHLPAVETVMEDSDDESGEQKIPQAKEATVLFSQHEEEFTANRSQKGTQPDHGTLPESNIEINTSASTQTSCIEEELANNTLSDPATNKSPRTRAAEIPQVLVGATLLSHTPETMDIDGDDETMIENESPHANDTFQHYTITQLQELARDGGVDISNCFERAEMIDLLHRAGISPNEDPGSISSILFSSWSVSQLRAVASELKVDLSQCGTREEIVEKILHEANTVRPYLRDYLRSLSPLTKKSLSDLRAIARELQVNISDCLEKDEIILRLMSRGTSVGAC